MQTSTNDKLLVITGDSGLSTRSFSSVESLLAAYIYVELGSVADKGKDVLKARRDELINLIHEQHKQCFQDYYLYECSWCGSYFDGENIGDDFCGEDCEAAYLVDNI